MTRFAVLALAALLATGAHAQAVDGRLKKILDGKAISIGYRADAMPFSFDDTDRQVKGYTVDICKAVVAGIERAHKVKLKQNWVRVTTQNRFDAIAKGQVDMECSSSTVTLARMKQVDFSSYIFLESTGVVVRAESGARLFDDLGNKTIAVVAGTTNERAVNEEVKRRGMKSTVVPYKTREEGFAAVESGKADAFASDKLLLVGASAKSKPGTLAMLAEDLSFEPYGIALPRGDAGLRVAVNAALSRLYRSEEMGRIFERWFGPMGRPSDLLAAVFIFGAIPE
jgi:ABC-type amino acid transport substrate-binding protein